MSDPRLIPADEARETLKEAQEPTTNLPWSDPWVGDLAYTVIAQADQIERLQCALKAVGKTPDDSSVVDSILHPGDME